MQVLSSHGTVKNQHASLTKCPLISLYVCWQFGTTLLLSRKDCHHNKKNNYWELYLGRNMQTPRPHPVGARTPVVRGRLHGMWDDVSLSSLLIFVQLSKEGRRKRDLGLENEFTHRSRLSRKE